MPIYISALDFSVHTVTLGYITLHVCFLNKQCYTLKKLPKELYTYIHLKKNKIVTAEKAWRS